MQTQEAKLGTVPDILYINSGSCNGCDIELLAAFVELQETGLKFNVNVEARKPRYDILVITGPVTAQSFCRISRMLREAGGRLEVEYAVLLGSCACGGGIWYDSYATLGGFDSFLNYLRRVEEAELTIRKEKIYITGCPVRPRDVAETLREILEKIYG